MRTFNLICPKCKKESLETTELFAMGRVNGTMFRQIKGIKVKSRHDAFTHVRGQNFQCPMCLQPVCTPGGNVTLKDKATGKTFLSNEKPPKPPRVRKPKKVKPLDKTKEPLKKVKKTAKKAKE